MKSLTIIILVVGFMGNVYAQMSSCLTSGTYNITGDMATFGCTGYGNSVSIQWLLNSTTPRMLTFTSFATENGYDKVTLLQGSVVWGPYSGLANPGSFMFLGGQIIVQFNTDGSNTNTGFTINMVPAPDVTVLQSAQPLTIEPKQDGGFVYFALESESMGASFWVQTMIHSYQGLEPPALFISVGRLPTLEVYDYTNMTVASGDGYLAAYTLNAPRDGTYYIGLFLYGVSTDIDIVAEWIYNLPFLTSGVKVTGSAVTGTPVFYQLQCAEGSSSLIWQISRQVPGGYPIAYISQGSVPNPANYQYALDTRLQSYIKFTVSNPNPYNNGNSNPGNYIVAVYDQTSLPATKAQPYEDEDKQKFYAASFEPLSSGFILQADYTA